MEKWYFISIKYIYIELFNRACTNNNFIDYAYKNNNNIMTEN